MQFGALGGLGTGVGVKHQIVQHCGALQWYIKTKILAVVTKKTQFPPTKAVPCACCAVTPPMAFASPRRRKRVSADGTLVP